MQNLHDFPNYCKPIIYRENIALIGEKNVRLPERIKNWPSCSFLVRNFWNDKLNLWVCVKKLEVYMILCHGKI